MSPERFDLFDQLFLGFVSLNRLLFKVRTPGSTECIACSCISLVPSPLYGYADD